MTEQSREEYVEEREQGVAIPDNADVEQGTERQPESGEPKAAQDDGSDPAEADDDDEQPHGGE